MKRNLGVAAGWAIVAAIIWLSVTPTPPRVDVANSDKVGHVIAYGVLMSWFCQLYRTRIYYAAGFILMGVALEFVQRELGYRSFEVADMVANALGVLLGWGVARLVPTPLLK